jgi:hypothetical protein
MSSGDQLIRSTCKAYTRSVYVGRFHAQSLAPFQSAPVYANAAPGKCDPPPAQSDCGIDYRLPAHSFARPWAAASSASVWLLPPLPHLLGIRQGHYPNTRRVNRRADGTMAYPAMQSVRKTVPETFAGTFKEMMDGIIPYALQGALLQHLLKLADHLSLYSKQCSYLLQSNHG